MSKQRAKGTFAETALVKALREDGYDAERIPLGGSSDHGDVVVREPGYTHIVEVKNCAKWNPAGWIAEALVERDNYCKARGLDPSNVGCCVVVKRIGKGDPRDWYTLSTVGEHFDLDVNL